MDLLAAELIYGSSHLIVQLLIKLTLLRFVPAPENTETISKRQTDRHWNTHKLAGTDAGKPDQVMQVTLRSSLAVLGGNVVNAILSISEKRETCIVPVRELRRGSVPDAECCALDDLCGIQRECFCRASAWKPPTPSGRKHSHRCTDPDTHKPQSVISVNKSMSVH